MKRKFYNELIKPKLSIRISANNFSLNGNVKDIPLYALFCLKIYCSNKNFINNQLKAR